MALTLSLGVTLVAAGVVLFVLLPILRGDWAVLESTEDEVTEAEARKQAALRGLRDAEYDFRAGKLDQADYQTLKSDLARQALEAMGEGGSADPAASEDPAVDASGGAEGGSVADSNGDDLEAEIARVRKGIAQGRTCPVCGHLNVKLSRFCTGCGGMVGGATTAAGKSTSG